MFSCTKPRQAPVHIEQLTPIDEEPAEDLAEDDQPITMIPKIVQTAPSPQAEQPPTYIGGAQKPQSTPTGTRNGVYDNNGKDAANKEVSQIESVL